MIAAILAASAFNLACFGTDQRTIANVESPATPYTIVLRIDLATKRWCGGLCTQTSEIARIEPRKIVLLEDSDSTTETHYTVNRENGNLLFLQRIEQNWQKTSAICRVKPFSGFPTIKF